MLPPDFSNQRTNCVGLFVDILTSSSCFLPPSFVFHFPSHSTILTANFLLVGGGVYVCLLLTTFVSQLPSPFGLGWGGQQ